MLINLKDIISAATIVNPNQLHKRKIEWKIEGNTLEAEVFIVSNISFAASERITIGSSKSKDAERLARQLVERVRFGENGEEKLSFEQASALHPALGWALVSAVYDFDNPEKDAEGTEATTGDATGDEEAKV